MNDPGPLVRRLLLVGALAVALFALKPLVADTYCGEPTVRAALSHKGNLHGKSTGTSGRAAWARDRRACINDARHQVVESGILLLVSSAPVIVGLDRVLTARSARDGAPASVRQTTMA